jgi:putative transposase
MELSEIGLLVKKYWCEIPNHFGFVKLDEFVVMPDHIHGIIIIDKPNDGTTTIVEKPKLGASTVGDTKHKKWKSGTLGVIINQYKRICTLNSRKINRDFCWQSRFYDTVVRDKESFNRIAKYIRDNPVKWQDNVDS